MENIFPYPIRVVVLDYPIRHWKDPAVQSMFCKITDLKLDGYWTKHGHDNVLPVDVSDLIGANVATCYETPDGLVPIMAFRMLSLSRCDLHRNKFPALSVLETSSQDPVRLNGVIESVREDSRDIVYASSWTRAAGLPESFAVKRFLRDIQTSNLLNFIASRKIDEFVACSVIKFRVHKYFDYLGMQRISGEFAQYSVFDQVVAMYHLEDFSKFSPAAQAVRLSYSDYWENRLELAVMPERIFKQSRREAA